MLFIKKYKTPLESREKHGTLRMGRRIPVDMKLPVLISDSKELLGHVEVLELRWLRYHEIDNQDILAFEYPQDIGDLRRDLESIYPDLRKDSWMTFFRFRFEDEGD